MWTDKCSITLKKIQSFVVMLLLFNIANVIGASSQDSGILYSRGPLFQKIDVAFPISNITETYTAGIASGIYRNPRSKSNHIFAISDRGPSFSCSEAPEMIGNIGLTACRKWKNVRFFPLPRLSPSIYRINIDIEDNISFKETWGTFQITDVISLKTLSGRPVYGTPYDQSDTNTLFETGVNLQGERINSTDTISIDPEAIVRLSDGTFWIAEELGPSLLHVSANGHILKRLVPAGSEKIYSTKVESAISYTLPEILLKRVPNRGIESLALSTDREENYLYFSTQTPLANPSIYASQNSRAVRIYKLDRKSETVVGEFLYLLDEYEQYVSDINRRQGTVGVSEMVAIGEDRLLILERTNEVARIYEIHLSEESNLLRHETDWDSTETEPTLEEFDVNDLVYHDIRPIKKDKYIFDTRELSINRARTRKAEGMSFLVSNDIVIFVDNDYGDYRMSKPIVIRKKISDLFLNVD